MHATQLLALLPLLGLASAAINGHCSGAATGNFKSDGICISTEECDSYSGMYMNNGCPYDGNDIKCCVIGLDPDYAVNPCGGYSACRWLTSSGTCPDGLSLHRNHCPGGDNYSCCEA